MFSVGDVIENESGTLYRIERVRREGVYDLVRLSDDELLTSIHSCDHNFALKQPSKYGEVVKAFGINYIGNVKKALEAARIGYITNKERDDIVSFLTYKASVDKARAAIAAFYDTLDKG